MRDPAASAHSRQRTLRTGPVLSYRTARHGIHCRRARSDGHTVTIADLRFGRSVDHYIRALRPALVGIAGMHALETDNVLDLAAASAGRRRRADRHRRAYCRGLPGSVPFGRRHGRRGRRRRARHAASWPRALEQRTPLSEVPGLVIRADRQANTSQRRRARHARARRRAAPGGDSSTAGAGNTRVSRIAPSG